MKYIVELKSYIVYECEKYNQFVEIVTGTLFDTRKEAQASSDELSELKEAEMQYRAGYEYACGYYD